MTERILEFRAILAGYSHPRKADRHDFMGTDGHFWDRDLWDKYLTLWSDEGYNAIVWIGANETGASAQGGHHILLRHDEFPEAREMPADENEEIIEQMRWLLRRAKDLGMKNFLYSHLVWVTPAFAKAHGLDVPMPISPTVAKFHNQQYGPAIYPNCGVVNDLTRAYTEGGLCRVSSPVRGSGWLLCGDRRGASWQQEQVLSGGDGPRIEALRKEASGNSDAVAGAD